MAKQHPNCPVCFTPMISKELTPCMDCGGHDSELDHYKEHDYKEWEVLYGERLVLCDFCDADFASYNTSFFGFKNRRTIGLEHFNFVKEIHDKRLRVGLFCPSCHMTHDFLKFVAVCREKNSPKW